MGEVSRLLVGKSGSVLCLPVTMETSIGPSDDVTTRHGSVNTAQEWLPAVDVPQVLE